MGGGLAEEVGGGALRYYYKCYDTYAYAYYNVYY